MVENMKAYEFLFDEDYTLTRGETVQTHEVKSEAAASTSVPRYLTLTKWVFGTFEDVLNASVLFPSAVGPDGRINLEYTASKFIYRICYPVWDGAAVEHDPTGIAYFRPIITPPGSSDGDSEVHQPFLTVWIVAIVASAVFVSAGLLAYFKKRQSSKPRASAF
jgi:hypothetical protein